MSEVKRYLYIRKSTATTGLRKGVRESFEQVILAAHNIMSQREVYHIRHNGIKREQPNRTGSHCNARSL